MCTVCGRRFLSTGLALKYGSVLIPPTSPNRSDSLHAPVHSSRCSMNSFPTGASPRPEVEIATLALTGIPRPHPFAMERGTDALEVSEISRSFQGHSKLPVIFAVIIVSILRLSVA